MRIRLNGSGGRLLHITGRITKPYQIRDSNNTVLIQMGKAAKTIEIPDNATSISISGVNIKTSTSPTQLSPRMEMYDELLNYRERNGLPGLRLDHNLNVSSQQHSQWLFDNNLFQHSMLPGVGENIAAGFTSVTAAMEALIASPPHNENLLYPGYRNVGIGIVAATSISTNNYLTYYTQQFL